VAPDDLTLARERPDAPDVAHLILELEAELAARYPAESRHGFSVDRLVAEGVDVWVLRRRGEPIGCGGLLWVDDPVEPYAEVKRMYVRPSARGGGHGRLILERLLDDARARGVRVVRLETGIDQRAAIALYEALGFRECPPFGPYREDPLSPCYELRLARSTHTA